MKLTLTELVTMERKSYCCNTCHKPLKCYSSLRTHQKLHNKYGEFVCHICGADFIWKGSFISHASFHVRAGDALNTEVCNFISNEFFIYSVHYALTPILRYFHAVCCLHESGNSALPGMFGIVDQSGITESVKLTSFWLSRYYYCYALEPRKRKQPCAEPADPQHTFILGSKNRVYLFGGFEIRK
ncbi:hypothetical protein T03_665 [Trichinella britovi]|uniref:C2H2-type domain-containing protein n=1 Tax=Trichinella britovi TaxID=45882 RepID=A0A0V1DJV6_TRIBR|nr:hypothetical protein T03_665 [Trichinella britovi]